MKADNGTLADLAVFGGRPTIRGKVRDRWRPVRLRDIPPIVAALRRGETTAEHGPAAKRLEDGFNRLCGTRYALAMNSGTAALHSAYFAVGVRPGDEVIVPSYTFFATATPLLQLGAVPVFCEIDRKTLTADPEDVERRITRRTRAICVVHIWGNPARLDAFVEMAQRHRVALIEDCSHAHGASFLGRAVGSFGDVGCFSLQGSKAVSGGEAGIAVTNNVTLFQRMLALGHNGRHDGAATNGNFSPAPLSYGLKYRPHTFAMHLAASSLSRLAEVNARRADNLATLTAELGTDSALAPVESYPGSIRGGYLEFLFHYRPDHAGQWSREAFVRAVREEGVPIAVERYSQLGKDFQHLHQAPMFGPVRDEFFRGYFGVALPQPPKLPVTECVVPRLDTLPAFTKVSRHTLRLCATAIRKVTAYAQRNPALL